MGGSSCVSVAYIYDMKAAAAQPFEILLMEHDFNLAVCFGMTAEN